MSLELARELWDELKQYLTATDQREAADSVVNLLIDNDFDPSDISVAFKGCTEIKQAISIYADELVEDEPDDEYDNDEYDDDDDEYDENY